MFQGQNKKKRNFRKIFNRLLLGKLDSDKRYLKILPNRSELIFFSLYEFYWKEKINSFCLENDSNESREIVSKVFRSESTSLPFGIANVLQSTTESTKISQIPISTSLSSVNPWLMALHHLSQSSSTTALANASNWCAKCSIQFRLTSELVHHIRLHHATRRHYYHQTSSTESTTRKSLTNSTSSSSSISLTCHICYETFRERHHLTRHMTSHR